jgi:hypothetical protein
MPKGCLISVSRRGAGSGGRDYDLASEMRCEGPAAQAAPGPACPSARRGPVMAGRQVLPSQEHCLKVPSASLRWEVMQQVSSSHGRNDHRGGCGASLKHRARDALGLADLRHALPIARTRVKGEHTGLRQASMSRGVEARGSNWTPGVPRALGWGRAAKEQRRRACPGPR